MTNFSDEEASESLNEAPEWLRNALEARRVSPGFRERCREAAMVAHDMAAMRRLRAEVGLIPETLERYVNDLAKAAGVKLEPVLRWLDVKSLAHPEPAEGRAYARLGKTLGLRKDDLVRHIAASLGVAEGTAVLAMGRNRHGNIPTSSVEVLDQMEADLSLGAKEKLHLIVTEITKEYGSGD